MRREIDQPLKFDEAFRQWAARPATSGTEAASKLFAPRDRRRAFLPLSPAWATLVSATLVIVSATAWWLGNESPASRLEPAPGAETGAARLPSPPTDSDVVVVWLDDRTPVHVFLTDASARGGK